MARINVYGRYPCRANWVTVRKKNDTYVARNGLTEEEYILSANVTRYLLSLDGNTHPLHVEGFSEEQSARMYNYLDKNELIRDTGATYLIGDTLMHTLYIPKKVVNKSFIFKMINFLLMASFLPVFFLGLYRVVGGNFDFSIRLWFVGIPIGLIFSMVPHELGHAIASFRYGALVYEIGLMRKHFFPGAYVLADDSRIKNTLHKAQINMAGIEVNFLITGIGLILVSLGHNNNIWFKLSGMIAAIAFESFVAALANIVFLEGLDGEHTLTNLLGIEVGSFESCVNANMSVLFSSKRRRKYFERNGANGFAYLGICCMWSISQILVPVFVITEIVAGIGVIAACIL